MTNIEVISFPASELLAEGFHARNPKSFWTEYLALCQRRATIQQQIQDRPYWEDFDLQQELLLIEHTLSRLDNERLMFEWQQEQIILTAKEKRFLAWAFRLM